MHYGNKDFPNYYSYLKTGSLRLFGYSQNAYYVVRAAAAAASADHFSWQSLISFLNFFNSQGNSLYLMRAYV